MCCPNLRKCMVFLVRRQNLVESFNNISLNIRFWVKYNLRQPTFCFELFQYVPEFYSNAWSKLLYIWVFKFQKKIWCSYFQSITTRWWKGRSTYKINCLFIQKLLNVSHNLGRQSNFRFTNSVLNSFFFIKSIF